MAEVAAHLVEHVFPQVPVRQWVVTFPRRLRHFRRRDPVLLGRVRRCVSRTIESGLRRRCPNAQRDTRCGAASFVQQFGSAQNAHTHLHCCVTACVAQSVTDFAPLTVPVPDPALPAATRRRASIP